MKSLYRKFILYIFETKTYRWFLINVLPFVRFSTYYPKVRGWQYLRGYSLLEDGDIILTTDDKKLAAAAIPGTMSHAALIVGKGELWEMSEMTHHGYTKSTFFDACKEADRVMIIRCRDWDKKYIHDVVIPSAKALEKSDYDIEFELGVQALYCSELIYVSDKEKRLKVDLSDLAGIGREYISPDGLMLADNIEIIWDSDKEVEPEYLKTIR